MITLMQRGRDLFVGVRDGEIPPDVYALLTETLSYRERTYDPLANTYHFINRRIFKTANKGRLIWTLAGFYHRLACALHSAGVPYELEEDPYYTDPEGPFTADWPKVAKLFAFRGRQDECLLRLASARFGCGVVEASVAWGKTFVIAALHALYPKAVGAVVTKSRDVFNQNHQKLTELLGPGVGRVTGGVYKPGRLTVCTADSAHKLGFDLDLVVGDEIHELAAPKYVAILARYRRAKMVGLTATFERDDNRHHELEGIFGPIVFTLPFADALELQAVNPITVEWIRPPCRYDPAADVVNPIDRERLAIWRNDERNRAIAERARAFAPGESVVIMTRTLEHACLLRRHLPEFTLCYGDGDANRDTVAQFAAAGLLPADEPRMTGSRREQLRNDFRAGRFKRAIATYIWSTGLDFPILGALIRADAAGSKIKDGQIPGRVCRLFAGKTGGRIVDCWDDFNTVYLAKSRSRRRNYARNGYAQTGP